MSKLFAGESIRLLEAEDSCCGESLPIDIFGVVGEDSNGDGFWSISEKTGWQMSSPSGYENPVCQYLWVTFTAVIREKLVLDTCINTNERMKI